MYMKLCSFFRFLSYFNFLVVFVSYSNTGRMAGGAYAGATAGNGVGASAAIGGNYDNEGGHGGSGAEAHANGITRKVVRLTQAENGVAPQTVRCEWTIIFTAHFKITKLIDHLQLTVVQKNIPVAAELDSRSSIESDEQDVKLVEVKPTQPPQVVYQKVKRKYRPHKVSVTHIQSRDITHFMCIITT